jgi:hypothetical protein
MKITQRRIMEWYMFGNELGRIWKEEIVT